MRACPCGRLARPGQGDCNACHAAYMRAWRATHPMTAEQRARDSARSYANVYKRRGKLVPRPCEVCGSTDEVQMHHDDYTKPLEVRWVCRAHHRALHRAERRAAS